MATKAQSEFDVLVVGGGIKGSAITRDAVGRGLRVLVCEQGDLASSCIKGLARNGLAAFQPPSGFPPKEARKAMLEWEILRRVSPHLTSPVSEHSRRYGLRYLTALFSGSGRKEASTKAPFQTSLSCHRFVMSCLRDAADRGAVVLPRTSVISAKRGRLRWSVDIKSDGSRIIECVTAKILVDTTGGKSPPFDSQKNEPENLISAQIAIVRGGAMPSEPILQEGQNGRRFFSINQEPDCHLIGVLTKGLNPVGFDVLLDCATDVLGADFNEAEILWHGDTAISDDKANEQPAREFGGYHIHIQTDHGHLPLFRVVGGTVSTARKLAEDTVAEMTPFAKMIGKKWTRTATLPGGDFQPSLRATLTEELQADFAFLAPDTVQRLFATYGTDCRNLLATASCEGDLGVRFCDDLFAAEVTWLMQKEWATTAEDIIWRRTRLGQKMTPQQIKVLGNWMARHMPAKTDAGIINTLNTRH